MDDLERRLSGLGFRLCSRCNFGYEDRLSVYVHRDGFGFVMLTSYTGEFPRIFRPVSPAGASIDVQIADLLKAFIEDQVSVSDRGLTLNS